MPINWGPSTNSPVLRMERASMSFLLPLLSIFKKNKSQILGRPFNLEIIHRTPKEKIISAGNVVESEYHAF